MPLIIPVYIFITHATNEDLEEILQSAEEYLVQVLQKGSEYKTLDQLRFHVYHQKSTPVDMLPPASHSIRPHFLRAYSNTYILFNCCNRECKELDPLEFGYNIYDGFLATKKKHKYITWD